MPREPKSFNVSIKDLARRMGLCPRSVKRWYVRLRIPPTVRGYSSHRWSEADAEKLLAAWQRAKNIPPRP